MSHNTKCHLLETAMEQKYEARTTFSKKVARAISNRVERIIQAEEARALLADFSKSSLWINHQEDEIGQISVSELPRHSKPLFSPEIAAELRSKLTK